MQKFILAGLILFIGDQCNGNPICDFFDTVDLTGSPKFPNGSFSYKNLNVPASLTGDYDYVIRFDGEKEPVPKHTRGCVCKLRPCIRFCCHPKKLMSSELKECSNYTNETLTYEYEMNVTQSDGTVVKKHILNDMIVQDELPLPCRMHYSLDAENEKEDMWTLFENGSLFRHYDSVHMSKREYCLQPNVPSTGKNYSLLVPYNCIIEPPLDMSYVQLGSIFCLFFTILFYLWLPKFRSPHGRSCCLYFICLTLSFLLNIFSMYKTFNDNDYLCLTNGYAGYFSIMAAFMWLSVISFNVWRNFDMRRSQGFYNNGRSSFFNYNVIVWSVAGVLTLLIMLVDQFEEFIIPIPGVGLMTCWINTNNWSGMIYLYTPLSILIIFSGAMFCLTTRYIYVENKSNQKELNLSEQQKKARNQANYWVYLRLFIIMGGSWFLEIINFMLERERISKTITTLIDVINSSQGMIIFLATICNRDMIRSIKKRI